MTTKHTPGPWFSSKDGWSVGIVTHNLPTGHIGNICVVQATGAKTQEEGNANARLIAAAPELLSCLKAALVRLEDYANLIEDTEENQNITITGGHINLVQEIESAIAKAEGREG